MVVPARFHIGEQSLSLRMRSNEIEKIDVTRKWKRHEPGTRACQRDSRSHHTFAAKDGCRKSPQIAEQVANLLLEGRLNLGLRCAQILLEVICRKPPGVLVTSHVHPR